MSNVEQLFDRIGHPETPGWYVLCDEFSRGPFKTQEQAEQMMVRIVEFGKCYCDHRVELVTVVPLEVDPRFDESQFLRGYGD